MQILIVGGGGREHALAWKAAQCSDVSKVFVAPGNAGTRLEKHIENIAIKATDIPSLLDFAQNNNIALTIVGPELPLVAGIVDVFTEAGLKCFGPTAQAAQLEGSKAYCKDFMRRYHIPTAKYQTFTTTTSAIDYIQQQDTPIVVKADGLAAGKGVVVAQTKQQAIATVKDMLLGNSLGVAGSRVVIEEFLEGEEASFIVIANHDFALPMATSQDHKTRDNGDQGPNTGGMGAYSPAAVITPAITQKVMTEIIKPTLKGMQADGRPYSGFLYAGLMINKNGDVKVLEYNCRFGDPETQPIMMRMKGDLVALCLAALNTNDTDNTGNTLSKMTCLWDKQVALGVVLATKNYPHNYKKGDIITGLDNNTATNHKVFHAGTAENNGNIITDGGRVLCACALGDTIIKAQRQAYEITQKIHWDNVFYRTDIGFKAVKK